MIPRTARRAESEADRYWRDKASPRPHYGAELAMLAVVLVVLALN